MSRSYRVNYELERARRQALYLKRIADTTERYLRQYQTRYESMSNNRYQSYIPDEMSQLSGDLTEVRRLLAEGKPEEARSISFRIGSYISVMEPRAAAAIDQHQRAERMRAEQRRIAELEKTNALVDIYFHEVSQISDPVALNVIQGQLANLLDEIKGGNAGYTESTIKSRIADIVAEAADEVATIKEEAAKKERQQSAEEQLREVKQVVEEAAFEDEEKTRQFLKRVQDLQVAISAEACSIEELGKQVAEIKTEVDETAISEEIRREAVRAIFRQLSEQDFSVEAPQLFEDGDTNYVRLVARRPSGKRAVCDIDNHGAIRYKFDNYDGMTCLQDIERFNVDLQRIYSIKLSDERILWENPDKLSRDSDKSSQDDRRYL